MRRAFESPYKLFHAVLRFSDGRGYARATQWGSAASAVNLVLLNHRFRRRRLPRVSGYSFPVHLVCRALLTRHLLSSYQLCRSRLGLIAQDDDAGGKVGVPGELKVQARTAVAEKPLPLSDDDRTDHEIQLIDQAVLQQRPHQHRAAVHDDVSAGLFFDLLELSGHIALHEMREI